MAARDTGFVATRRISLLGVPTSAGAFAPGQEQAPAALREAGLVAALEHGGLEVIDHGDREVWRWRPDRESRRAQNAGKVAEIIGDTARRVSEADGEGGVSLVLGGDCTIGIGTVAAYVGTGERVGLVYFDTHADLNVPESVREGALDWMGMAHMLCVDGAVEEVARSGPRVPLLEPDQVVLFAWGPAQATEFERDVVERKRLDWVAVDEVATDAQAAARRALDLIETRCERLLIHFDVDVIDFTDVPLSENWGRNEGLPYETAMRALRVLLGSPKLAGITVTELNPDHAEEGAGSIERFVSDLAGALAQSA